MKQQHLVFSQTAQTNAQSRRDEFKSSFSHQNDTMKKDSRKTRKRDTKIMNSNKQINRQIPNEILGDEEEEADVQEITTLIMKESGEPNSSTDATAEPTIAAPTTITAGTTITNIAVDATDDPFENLSHENVPDTETEASTESVESAAVAVPTTTIPMGIATSTTTTAPDDSQSAGSSAVIDQAIIEIIDTNFEPASGYYYGGQPNPNADFIYFTTTATPPNENGGSVQTQTVQTVPDSSSANKTPDLIHHSDTPFDRNDVTGMFKPSIQYEYKNYRYDVDEHFVPIVGLKQIF